MRLARELAVLFGLADDVPAPGAELRLRPQARDLARAAAWVGVGGCVMVLVAIVAHAAPAPWGALHKHLWAVIDFSGPLRNEVPSDRS